jgi:hypothetical protein
MITQERAQEIKEKAIELTQYGPWADKLTQAMTPEEDVQVRQHWSALPGSASYMDAFLDFLHGTTGEVG